MLKVPLWFPGDVFRVIVKFGEVPVMFVTTTLSPKLIDPPYTLKLPSWPITDPALTLVVTSVLLVIVPATTASCAVSSQVEAADGFVAAM
jgi:hypothetical protein